MPEQSDVKVFISWSGDLAKDVAVALREWLPLFFDRVVPWASDTDIAAGQRGMTQIEAELTGTRLGIVVVTADNQAAPWLNFEAGALSRVVGEQEHRVVPLLVDLTGPAQLTGPLSQFQAKTADREGVRDVVRSVATVAGVDATVVDGRFEAFWPQLEAAITAAKSRAEEPATKQTKRPQGEVLDEILLHVRALRADGEPLLRTLSGAVLGEKRVVEHRDLSFSKKVTTLALKHNLRLLSVSPSADTGGRTVSVEPMVGDAGDADIIAFADSLRKYLPGENVNIEVIPF